MLLRAKYRDDRGKDVMLHAPVRNSVTRERELDYVVTTSRIRPDKSVLEAWGKAQARKMFTFAAVHFVLYITMFAGPMLVGKTPFSYRGSNSLSLALTDRLLGAGKNRELVHGLIHYGYLAVLVGSSVIMLGPMISMSVRAAPGPYCYRRLLLRRCPSCDFSLMEITAEADGCTVCPECGAAWRIPAEAIAPGTPTRSRWD
ncbi:MAG TPA: zinc ribbon domain-containing protein [Phycisphaerales bacterium]|nr:zinc ribbon domain-containing protein [Phycisphaerales bacterium]